MVLAGDKAKQVQWTNVYLDALVRDWLFNQKHSKSTQQTSTL